MSVPNENAKEHYKKTTLFIIHYHFNNTLYILYSIILLLYLNILFFIMF